MAYKKQNSKATGLRLASPFLAALAVLTVVSFLIPLRPTRSQMEKRDLAKFPEFSWEALVEGSYFDDITTWFSDTFPGREGWLTLSSGIASLHGHSEITIAGDLPVSETVPQIPEPTKVQLEDDPGQPEEVIPETTAATEPAWGGVDAGNEDIVELGDGTVVQIGDSAFNPVGFSKDYSDQYAQSLSRLAGKLEDQGIRVVSAPAPTAMGVLVEKEYMELFNSADQKDTIDYLHGSMSDLVVKADTIGTLLEHNSEYVYFRTDHHWTARGAYYAYVAICDALGMEALALEEFEEFDQGELEGSLYWRVSSPKKLKKDTLYTYMPPYDIDITIQGTGGGKFEGELIRDVRDWNANAKYSAFICSDNPLSIITNNDLPEDGPCAILVKDSFGNALAPFLACNYRTVYVIDYRKYHTANIAWFVRSHEVDDVIFSPYVIGIQSKDGNAHFERLCY